MVECYVKLWYAECWSSNCIVLNMLGVTMPGVVVPVSSQSQTLYVYNCHEIDSLTYFFREVPTGSKIKVPWHSLRKN
jgi:hypothetical protein